MGVTPLLSYQIKKNTSLPQRCGYSKSKNILFIKITYYFYVDKQNM